MGVTLRLAALASCGMSSSSRRSWMEQMACAVYALRSKGSLFSLDTKSVSMPTHVSPSGGSLHIACGSATCPLGRTSSTPTLSCIETSSSTALESTSKWSVNAEMIVGSSSRGGSVADDQMVLYGAASIACTMYPVSESIFSASPLPWSAPIVGSSIISTVFIASSCLQSHAHEATSQTNMRGCRMTCTCRLRTRWLVRPPVVWLMRSTPSRSFSSI
mmetsp:Transcript_143/g.370  ORF Transcript_143/g.370 Transcript_143/m.370 type:complete len:217 (+) Transcript_143:1469-2119(+)